MIKNLRNVTKFQVLSWFKSIGWTEATAKDLASELGLTEKYASTLLKRYTLQGLFKRKRASNGSYVYTPTEHAKTRLLILVTRLALNRVNPVF